ncbi:MAG: RHS repeat domain-containing protein [Nitrospira sp.]|nr:RHS repeat domain-containing protein [Nitrospira sp.]
MPISSIPPGGIKKVSWPNGDSRELRLTELTGVPDLANGIGVFGNHATISQSPVIQATFKDAKGQTTTFTYDANGNVITTADTVNRSPAAICMKLGRLGVCRLRLRRLA